MVTSASSPFFPWTKGEFDRGRGPGLRRDRSGGQPKQLKQVQPELRKDRDGERFVVTLERGEDVRAKSCHVYVCGVSWLRWQ